jgi:uncharacterized protein
MATVADLETSNDLSLLIKPSSHTCNLRCAYCFYKRVEEIYGEKGTFMAAHVAEVMIEKAWSMGASRNSFCWQGGEPTLLGVDFFKHVVAIQEKHRKPYQIIENTLQTNGTLLDEKGCRFLREKNILVGISLDGPASMHNRYRKSPDGKGTYERVMKSISLMRKSRVKFNILTLLTDANVQEGEQLYAFFRKNRFNYLQFVNCLERNSTSGALPRFSVGGEEVGKFYCTLFDLWLKDGFPHVSIRLFEDVLIYYFNRVHSSCCWMERCNSYIVVEHNGDCYPCDFFVYPEWRLGNIGTDDLRAILNSPKRERFGELKAELPEACTRCELLSFCRGDCTKFRQPHEGAISGGRSEYCIALKMLLEHMAPQMPAIEERVMRMRTGTGRKEMSTIGRNEPCPCGSGKKFKKCCKERISSQLMAHS